MKVAFFGSGSFALASFRALVDAKFTPVLVVTQPPRRRGRGGKTIPTEVHAAALELDIPVLAPPKINKPEPLAELADVGADLFLVAEYGQILSRKLLAIPPLGTLNVHGSILPRWRGATPVAAALLAGDETTGVTIQRTVYELDAGPVLATREVRIEPDDDRGSLFWRLAEIGGALLVEVVRQFAAGDPPPDVEQDAEQATFCRRIAREETWIDWTQSAAAIARHVRAFTPRPGARTSLLRDPEWGAVIERVSVADRDPEKAAAGAVVGFDGDAIHVATGDGCVAIEQLKPAGRRSMSGGAFRNGYQLQSGERFGGSAGS